MSEGRARRGFAETAADSTDPRLRGRTYAVPFEDVWQAARRVAGTAHWTISSANDQDGVIEAHAGALIGEGHDVVIRIVLDMNAQTRVDASAVARKPATDLGRSARLLGRLFRELDRSLANAPRRGTAQSTRGTAQRTP
jgi:hypothetical protein